MGSGCVTSLNLYWMFWGQHLSDIQNVLGKNTAVIEEFPFCVLGPVAAENRLCRDCIGQMMVKIWQQRPLGPGASRRCHPHRTGPACPQPPRWPPGAHLPTPPALGLLSGPPSVQLPVSQCQQLAWPPTRLGGSSVVTWPPACLALALWWPGLGAGRWDACSGHGPHFLTSAALGLRSEDTPCWGSLRLCLVNPPNL